MTVIARDQVAADHLVYAWPFPIGPECEVSCADDEQVVMCPAWMVGDRLGPGRHLWRTPDPTRPVAAFFVRTTPVDVVFDMLTSFLIPTTGLPVRLRASGILQVRCGDPSLLVAQFVGLPFDRVNEGVLRSVSRSVERMIARLLTRRVVMAATPFAVTDPSMLPSIIEELVAYNPTAGAVFGIDLLCVRHLAIAADDGASPYLPVTQPPMEWSGQIAYVPPEPVSAPVNGHGHDLVPSEPGPTPRQYPRPVTPKLETDRGMGAATPEVPSEPPRPRTPTAPGNGTGTGPGAEPAPERVGSPPVEVSGEIIPRATAPRASSQPPVEVSGEISPRARAPSQPPVAVSGEIVPRSHKPTMQGMAPMVPPAPIPRIAKPIEVPRTEETTIPLNRSKIAAADEPKTEPPKPEPRGAVVGSGMAASAATAVSGEIPLKIPAGGRVLVAGPTGLMQSATVRQLVGGYYELEVGHTGETIWVPMSGVVPE